MDILKNLFSTAKLSGHEQAIFKEWLISQLEAQVHAKLEQGGHTVNQIPLRSVFVDLPVSDSNSSEPDRERVYFLRELLSHSPFDIEQVCSDLLRDTAQFSRISPSSSKKIKVLQPAEEVQVQFAANILIGGPGQGKSTLSQLASQIHRAALLQPCIDGMSLSRTELISSFDQQHTEPDHRLWPQSPLLPVQVSLPDLATWLAKSKNEITDGLSHPQILVFIAQLASSKKAKLSLDLLERMVRVSPLLLVFDGLDEVGASEDRQRLISSIRELILWLGSHKVKAQIIATTRPQGYSGELAQIGVPLSEHYLVPLLQSEALEYAEKLLKAKISNPDDQQKMLGRIEEAAQDSSTARLLTTPLQVTILAALVQQIGRAPRERWNLFERYFSYTYDREIERETYASNLLSAYKPQIERIHARVGLILQIEADRDGGASARMPRDKLLEVINAVLNEDEFSPEDQRQLAYDIAIAAENRLVFIVEPEPNSYGFEIRSLQEFMAAWALTEGRDTDIEKRISLIAGASIFRNVMLFIASRLYSAASPLRDHIAQICSSIDEANNADTKYSNVRTGATLALEILEEGSVHTQPKRARALMEQAVKILRLPVSSAHARLAGVATSDTSAVLYGELEEVLEKGDSNSISGAFLALARLTIDDERNAALLIKKYWHRIENPTSLLTNCQREGVPLSKYLFKLIEEQAEFIQAHSILNTRTTCTHQPTMWSQWLHTVRTERAWIRTSDAINSNLIVESDLALPPEPEYPIPTVWKGYYLWLKYEHQPSKESLADLIDQYSKDESREIHAAQWMQSWPLRAILKSDCGKTYLSDVALRLRKGLLGDVTAWRKAQKKWEEQHEDQLKDVFHAGWDSVPWDKKLINSAPPFFLIPIWRLGDKREPQNMFEVIRERFKATSSQKLKSQLAEHGLFFIRVSPGNFRAKLDDLVQFLETSPKHLAMAIPRPKSITAKDWHTILEKYGDSIDDTWLLPPEFALEGYSRKEVNTPLFAAAVRAINDETYGFRTPPQQLSSLANLLFKVTPKNDVQLIYVWLLQIYVGTLDPAHDFSVTELLKKHSEGKWWLAASAIRAVQKGNISQERKQRFFNGLLAIVHADQKLAAICIASLQSILGSRKTNIGSLNVWNRLGFSYPLPQIGQTDTVTSRSQLQPVFLKEIELVNIGRIESIKLSFPEVKQSEGQWIVLLGQNGAGKSSILRSIVVGLRNVKEASIWPSRSFSREWIRLDEDGIQKEARIRITTSDATITTTIKPGIPLAFDQTPEFVEALPIPVFAYGCRRGSATGGVSREVDLAEGMEIATLMDDGASVVHAETWLKDLDGDAQKTAIGRARYDGIRTALTRLLDLKEIWVENRRVWVAFESGPKLPFSELSDGYLTSAGWFIDLLARWIHFYENKGKNISGNFLTEMTGLVLIDELDLHLHPKWQVEIIRKTRQLLPKMSFVVTTHNPLTLVGAEANEIWHLEIVDGNVCASQGIEPPLLLTGGQLYKRYFGIHDVYPSSIGRSMQRLSFLSGLPQLTKEEKSELETHRNIVREAGIPVELDDSGEIDAIP